MRLTKISILAILSTGKRCKGNTSAHCQMYQTVSNCIKLYQTVSKCIVTYQSVSKCILMVGSVQRFERRLKNRIMACRGHFGFGTFKDALMCQILYGSVAMKWSILKCCHLLFGPNPMRVVVCRCACFALLRSHCYVDVYSVTCCLLIK